ncbi:hypothetical protein [Shewanella halifaxensis]|uniref:hypothetical protein n=1 Tax=Shewanella halifaxensis TaxID=271098 RepID=UPI0002F2024C|nr:hypothetical protein [Shewanella halifaxensis]
MTAQPITDAQLCQLKQIWLNKALSGLDSQSQLAKALSATAPQDKLHPLTGPWQRINAVTPAQLQAITQRYFSQNSVRLDLLPPWYIRATKSILEFLPKGMTDSLEESVM